MIRLHISDEATAARHGFNPWDSLQLACCDDIPDDFATDHYTCPYAYKRCLGSKDPEFEARCTGRDLPYLNCKLYKDISRDVQQIDQDRLLALGAGRKNNHVVSVGDSVQDAIDDGANPLDIAGIGLANLRNSRGYDHTRQSLWPGWSEELARLFGTEEP